MSRPATIRTLPNFAFAAMSVDAGDQSGAPKDYLRLVPMGVIKGRDGRGPYRLDDLAHAQLVVDASMTGAGGTDLPVDYDHQIPFAVKDGVGGQAKASGWIKGLEAKPDGIWARVEWTPAASAAIAAKEYRYISPYFSFEADTGRITKIWNAGLVNLPNFTDLAAVASADIEGSDMNLQAIIAKALGLADDATPEQIATAAAALKTKADSADERVAAAAAAAQPDPKAFVPMAVFTELQGQVKTLQDSSAEEKATAAVDTAIKAGKITPAGRDHALALYKADAAAFDAFIGAAPVVVKPGAVDTSVARANLDAPISDDERRIAKMIGVTEEAFLASRKQLMTSGDR